MPPLRELVNWKQLFRLGMQTHVHFPERKKELGGWGPGEDLETDGGKES